MSQVTATVTELPESRVKIAAEVAAKEVDARVLDAAGRLGRDLRIDGFRKGKVPPPVVLRRVGREAVLDDAIRNAIGNWYSEALTVAGVEPVGEPDISLDELPGAGEPFTFSIEIGVRPEAELGEYKGVEVGRREPAADEEQVEAELERMRERLAKLETVDRAAGEGDGVVMDYVGSIDDVPFEGGEGRDQLVMLGSGRLVPGFEEQLTGAKAGDERTVEITFPDDYQAEHLAGQTAKFAVTVHEVKERQLPELDDDFALDSGGFDTLEEMREDIRKRLREADEQRLEGEYREAVLDAAVAVSTIEIPSSLVHARAHEMVHDSIHRMEQQGIDKDTYLKIIGKTEHELAEEAEESAGANLAREAVLAKIIEAEQIEATDEDLLADLGPIAAQEGTTPEKLLKKLRKKDRLGALERDVKLRKAIDMLVEHASPITVEQAKARDLIWTPGKDEEDAPKKSALWTPGD